MTAKKILVNLLNLFSIHAEPSKRARITLAMLPFIIFVGVYLMASHARLEANPQDKLLPSVSKMAKAVNQYAFTKNERTGEYLMLKDTVSSLRRIGLGVALGAASGLIVGLYMGLFPGARSVSSSFITFISMVPPLSILPILSIMLGVGELAKVMLIFIGISPTISKDIQLAVQKISNEQITKALTLGASENQIPFRIVMPQIMPRLIDAVRLSLGAAWLFLIASEALASTDGLGYRIFLVRRYLAMDLIIPCVGWITFIGFVTDWMLRKLIQWKYPWYVASK